MKFTVKQVFLVFAVFAAMLGLLMGAQWVYLSSAVRSPLLHSLQNVPGVRTVQVSSHGAVTVDLAEHSNLMAAYQAVAAKAQQVTGRAPSSIAVLSHPSSDMVSLVDPLRLIIAQGEATGQYVAMNSAIQKLAGQHHLTSAVQLGNHHIFVTLDAPGYWLDIVMPLRLGGAG